MSTFANQIKSIWESILQNIQQISFTRESVVRFFAYFTFFAGIYAIFLFVFLSSDAIQPFIDKEVQSLQERGILITESRLSLLPFEIRAKQIMLTKKITKSTPIRLDNISIIPRWATLITGKLGAHVEASVYGGQLASNVAGSAFFGTDTLQAQTTFNGIQLTSLPLESLSFLDLHGEISGVSDASLILANIVKSSATLTLSSKTLAATLPLPAFKISQLTNGTLQLAVDYRAGKLKIAQCILGAPALFDFSVHGEVAVNSRNFMNSKITGKFTFRAPKAQLNLSLFPAKQRKVLDANKPLQASFVGTIQSPTVRW